MKRRSSLLSLLWSYRPPSRIAQVLLASIALGAAVGVLVAGFYYLVEEILLEWLFELETWQQALLPTGGLILAALILKILGSEDITPSTSDEYIKAFHERTPRLPLRNLPAKLLAGVTTIGFGGALGLEGPSIYSGASLGENAGRLTKWFRRDERKMLMVAGAAAGVAAIFRAPATGVIFALEAPYRDDTTRRALLPALIASAVSFLVFFAIFPNSHAIFSGLGEQPIQLRTTDLLGGAVIGLAAGLGGRSYAWLIRAAKRIAAGTHIVWRFAVGGILMGGMVFLTNWAFGESLSLGPGQQAVSWAIDPDKGLPFLALLFGIRIMSTATTVSMSGTGGLFIPLVTQGIIMGAFIGDLLGEENTSLYPILGLAAFLGAGYRVPIAAVVFVAEATLGSPFVVPALVASAVSQLVAGPSSVANYQVIERLGHLESRLTLPITSALTTDVLSVPPDASVSEFVYQHVLGHRQREVPVVDNGQYMGMCTLEAISEIERDLWETTQVRDVLLKDLPAGNPNWTLRDAVATMEAAGIETLVIVDNSGALIGVIYEADILKLREILEETGN